MHKRDMHPSPLRLCTVALLLCALTTSAARAQTAEVDAYPSRPVRMIVNSGAGASADTMARQIAPRVAADWKQPIVIDNRPGASGTLGADVVAKSAADGYTLLLGVTSLIQTPYLMPRLPYDINKDLTAVTMIAKGPNALVVPTSSPANSVKEFIAMVKANPGKHNFGTYGPGTTAHILGEAFNRQARLDLVHTPYRGTPQMLTDVMGGQIGSAFPDLASAMPHIRAGKLKVLAISGPQRHKSLPNVPTFSEEGFAGFDAIGWYGLFVPAGTPTAIVQKIAAAWGREIKSADISAKLEDTGLQPAGDTPADFAAVIRNDGPVWGKAIRDGNIKID